MKLYDALTLAVVLAALCLPLAFWWWVVRSFANWMGGL